MTALFPRRGYRKSPSMGFCDAGRKTAISSPYVFNGLQPPKTAVRPCAAEAVASCDSL
jgi:hypothetical protein